MSVYTMPSQAASTMGQSAHGPYDQSLGGFGTLSQQSWQSQLGGAGALAQSPWISDLAYRIASASVSALAETLRFDQQTLQAICSQGQLPQQAFAHLVSESSRRITPIVAATITAVASQAQGTPFWQGGPTPTTANGYSTQAPWGGGYQQYGHHWGSPQFGSPHGGMPQGGMPPQIGTPQFGMQFGTPQFGPQLGQMPGYGAMFTGSPGWR